MEFDTLYEISMYGTKICTEIFLEIGKLQIYFQVVEECFESSYVVNTVKKIYCFGWHVKI